MAVSGISLLGYSLWVPGIKICSVTITGETMSIDFVADGDMFTFCENFVSRYPIHPTGMAAVLALCSAFACDTSRNCDSDLMRGFASWLIRSGDLDESEDLAQQLDEVL